MIQFGDKNEGEEIPEALIIGLWVNHKTVIDFKKLIDGLVYGKDFEFRKCMITKLVEDKLKYPVIYVSVFREMIINGIWPSQERFVREVMARINKMNGTCYTYYTILGRVGASWAGFVRELYAGTVFSVWFGKECVLYSTYLDTVLKIDALIRRGDYVVSIKILDATEHSIIRSENKGSQGDVTLTMDPRGAKGFALFSNEKMQDCKNQIDACFANGKCKHISEYEKFNLVSFMQPDTEELFLNF